MFETPYVMKLAQNLARHAGARQSQIAKNIANADTPGYRARDLTSFADSFEQVNQGRDMRATRAGHMEASPQGPAYRTRDVGGQASPNGNNVSVEVELARGTDAKSSHDLAMTVYKSSLDMLRTSLGRGR
ncbi:MAG: FlgB family protein [Silicimonas sp.]|nr:FlgB family protein [Silicimonas sp.]